MNKLGNNPKFDLYYENQKTSSIKNIQHSKYAIMNNPQIKQIKNHNVSYDGVRKDMMAKTTTNDLVNFIYL